MNNNDIRPQVDINPTEWTKVGDPAWSRKKKLTFLPTLLEALRKLCKKPLTRPLTIKCSALNGTPTKRQVSKRQVSKRPVSKRLVSKPPVFKCDILINQKVLELPSLHSCLK
jgi:hypothetical protein